MIIGDRLRKARQAKNLSLQQVAERTHLSSATLSRIETGKQGLDLEVFVQLSKALDLQPAELIGEVAGSEGTSRASLISRLDPADRLRMWHDLASQTRSKKPIGNMRRAHIRAMAAEVEDLAAQVEFIREQIDYLRRRLRNC